MKILKLNFDNIPQLSNTDRAYTLGDAALRPFYEHEVQIEQFAEVIKHKKFDNNKRQILVTELEKQYTKIEASEKTKHNIQRLLQPNCYTIVTAHQPSLFTGPLYFIYKIVSAINLAEQLADDYPKETFVPVFVTGGEDHDFEEVNHINLFGNKISWEDEQGGSVGMYNVASLKPVLEQVKTLLGDREDAQKIATALEQCYTNASDYSQATKQFVNWIFGVYGLVVLDANTKAFKAQMIPIFKEELLEQSSKTIVENTANELESAGFKKQAHVRDINLFYLSPNKRTRIVQEDGLYKILDRNLVFSEAELLLELEQNPQNFSPNVILRPLFQETILPNLAYIGGGGELAYWLERKAQFEHYHIPFPMLVRRCSALWVDSNSSKKLESLGMNSEQLFEDIDQLLKQYVLDNSGEELSLLKEQEDIVAVFNQVLAKTMLVDGSLEKSVLAQQAQVKNALEKLEERLIRSEKKKNETSLEQIRKLKDKLFPNNGLQERHDNFLTFYSRYGAAFLDVLKANLNPLDKKFILIVE